MQAVALRHPELPTPAGAPPGARLRRARRRRCSTAARSAPQIAPGLYEAELHFLHDHEWARSADDVLWRRSKLGLHYNATVRTAVAEWCHRHWGTAAPADAEATAAATERSWN